MERDVLDLQESAGNAAVAGLVGGASVQRADDQPDSVGASSSGNAVMRALWNGNVIDPLKTATQALILEPSDYKRAYAKTVQALETASMAKDGMAANDPNRGQVLSLARDLQFVLLKIAPKAGIKAEFSDLDLADELVDDTAAAVAVEDVLAGPGAAPAPGIEPTDEPAPEG